MMIVLMALVIIAIMPTPTANKAMPNSMLINSDTAIAAMPNTKKANKVSNPKLKLATTLCPHFSFNMVKLRLVASRGISFSYAITGTAKKVAALHAKPRILITNFPIWPRLS